MMDVTYEFLFRIAFKLGVYTFLFTTFLVIRAGLMPPKVKSRGNRNELNLSCLIVLGSCLMETARPGSCLIKVDVAVFPPDDILIIIFRTIHSNSNI